MLSEILKEKRKELKLTQQEIADQLNVTRQTVSSWEVGKSIPDISSLIEISELYDISLDYMLKGDKQVTEKLKKDTVELKFLRYFSESALIMVSILLIIILPISIVFIAAAILYLTIFKKKDIKIITNIKEPKPMKKSSSYLGQALTDSFSLIGAVALFFVIVSFFIGNDTLFFEKQSKIYLIILFVGRTIVSYLRLKKESV